MSISCCLVLLDLAQKRALFNKSIEVNCFAYPPSVFNWSRRRKLYLRQGLESATHQKKSGQPILDQAVRYRVKSTPHGIVTCRCLEDQFNLAKPENHNVTDSTLMIASEEWVCQDPESVTVIECFLGKLSGFTL